MVGFEEAAMLYKTKNGRSLMFFLNGEVYFIPIEPLKDLLRSKNELGRMKIWKLKKAK